RWWRLRSGTRRWPPPRGSPRGTRCDYSLLRYAPSMTRGYRCGSAPTTEADPCLGVNTITVLRNSTVTRIEHLPATRPRVHSERAFPRVADARRRTAPLVPGEPAHQQVTKALEHLHDHHQQNDRRPQEVVVEALIPLTDGQVTQSPTTDGPGHRRVVDEVDHGHQQTRDETREWLGKAHLAHDGELAGSHGVRGLDHLPVDVAQRGLRQAGEEGDRADAQRNDRGRGSDRGA